MTKRQVNMLEAEELNSIRKQLNLSLRGMAFCLGISEDSIHRYIKGQRPLMRGVLRDAREILEADLKVNETFERKASKSKKHKK